MNSFSNGSFCGGTGSAWARATVVAKVRLANEARDDEDAALTARNKDERASEEDMVDSEQRMSVTPSTFGGFREGSALCGDRDAG